MSPDASCAIPTPAMSARDLKVIAETVMNLQKRTVAGPAFIGLIAEAQVSPETRSAFLAEFAERRRQLTRAVLRRAIARGELRADTDIDLVIDVIGGATMFRSAAGARAAEQEVYRRGGRAGVIGLSSQGATNVIRACTAADVPVIDSIINEAAAKYRGVIPTDCWHEPYMSRAELEREIAAGVNFSGWEDAGELIGVMGVQRVKDATLIRHAYVRTVQQGKGIGGKLLKALSARIEGKLLIGTWADASWAIRFYQGHGFRLVSDQEKNGLLNTYWSISPRQRDTSVGLTRG